MAVPHVVILGGGFGGAYAAQALSRSVRAGQGRRSWPAVSGCRPYPRYDLILSPPLWPSTLRGTRPLGVEMVSSDRGAEA